MNDRAQLGNFLRRRRERLSPAEVGLPVGGRRRTPGLRRDEVASLANMSTVYYERLEQGRGPLPSATVLAAMADALRLTDDERDHLYLLAGQTSPTASNGNGCIDSGLQYLLTAVESSTPAFITDDLGSVLAQNWLNVELFGEFAGLPGHGPNLVWRWFTSSQWRHLLEPAHQHEDTGQAYVADLRTVSARRGHSGPAATLVRDLRQASPEFARMWEQHDVSATLHCSTKVVHNARVGRVDLECAVVASPLKPQRLLLLQPVLGTPSKERLTRLATYKQPVAGRVSVP